MGLLELFLCHAMLLHQQFITLVSCYNSYNERENKNQVKYIHVLIWIRFQYDKHHLNMWLSFSISAQSKHSTLWNTYMTCNGTEFGGVSIAQGFSCYVMMSISSNLGLIRCVFECCFLNQTQKH